MTFASNDPNEVASKRRTRTSGAVRRRYPRTFRPWVVWYAIAFHVLAGALILLNPRAGHSTGPDGVVRLVGQNEVAGVVMLLSAALALWYMRGGVSVIWLLPQQGLLMLAATNAIGAVLVGEYADGTERAAEFILTDQLPVILMAVFHLLVILEFDWRWDRKHGLWRASRGRWPRLGRDL